VTPNARPPIGTLQKHMPTLTLTATNQTAGPLGCNKIFIAICPLAPGVFYGSNMTTFLLRDYFVIRDR